MNMLVTNCVKGFVQIGNLPGKVFFGSNYINIKSDFQYLKNNNVVIIWNLLLEENPKEKEKFIVIQTPTPDFGIPKIEIFISHLEKIYKYLKEGKNIYIHCMGGIGRTGMAILALKIAFGEDIEKAKEEITRIVGGPETEEQIKLAINIKNHLFHFLSTS